MAIPSKGLREIRTLSGRADRVVVLYKAYMTISCLEMEKQRRTTEKESASRRISSINARLAEIERDKTALLQALGERGDNAVAPREPSPSREGCRGRGRFRIKY